MEEGRITRREAAELLGVTPQSVANLVARGVLTTAKIGKWSYFSREEVLSLIPKTDAVRNAEKGIAEVVEDLERERAERVSEAMVYKARREFIERMTDVATFHRYQELVATVFDCIEACGMLGEKMTVRELDVLDQIIHLRPLGEIAMYYGLSENRVKQIFERALRRMVHFAGGIGKNYSYLESQLEAVSAERQRLAGEVERLNILMKDHFKAVAAKESILTMPWSELEVSVRTENCMRYAGIGCLGELALKSRKDVARTRNLGAKTMEELDKLMKRAGLRYGMTADELINYTKQ